MKNSLTRCACAPWIPLFFVALLLSMFSAAASAQPAPYEHAARQASPGQYAESLRGQQVYWTILGVPRDRAESLFDEYGNLEPTRGGSTLMPYVFTEDALQSALSAKTVRQDLDSRCLPIPSVTWSLNSLSLTITAYAQGDPGESCTWVRYRLSNTSSRAASGRFFLAVRPVQINPSWQFGGMSPIRALSITQTPAGCEAQIDGATCYLSLTAPEAFGVQAFDQGDVVQVLARGEVPSAHALRQDDGLLSGALAYDFSLEPGAIKDAVVVAPLHPGRVPADTADADAAFKKGLAAVRELWREQLGRATIGLTDADLADTARAQLAYMLVNKDNDALQPGSRHYEISWIRDGSVISAALLRMGIQEPVREYIDWYAGFITPEGIVPPSLECTASPGAGAGNEMAWDSQGEFVYTVMEYYRATKDLAFLQKHFDDIVRALQFLEKLRGQTLSPDYMKDEPARERFVGILPKSYSHKGYRTDLHIYWDDLWALKGWKDGKAAAEAMNRPELAKWADEQHKLLKASLRSSIEATIANKKLDYIPGCAERGDFDPTSTSIAFFPCEEQDVFPPEQLKATYDRYYKELLARGDPAWRGLFVSFDVRNVYAFLALGQKDRAQYLLDYIMKCRKPAEWRELAAVVYGDPRQQGYIGDMPHSWTGADLFIAARMLQDSDDTPK